MAKQTPLPHKSLLTRALAMAALLLSATAMTMAQDIKADTTAVKADTTAVKAKHGLVARLLQYFAESDKPKPDKKIDFGIIGGPHYASDTGLGLGLVASALYSTDRSDSTLEKSNASLYSDMTTKGFLMSASGATTSFRRNATGSTTGSMSTPSPLISGASATRRATTTTTRASIAERSLRSWRGSSYR